MAKSKLNEVLVATGPHIIKKKKNKKKKSNKSKVNSLKHSIIPNKSQSAAASITETELPHSKVLLQDFYLDECRNKESIISSMPVKISLNVNIASTVAANQTSDPSNNTDGWSWGAAFAAAATIRPKEGELDDDFLQRTAESNEIDQSKENVSRENDIERISMLVKEHVTPMSASNQQQQKIRLKEESNIQRNDINVTCEYSDAKLMKKTKEEEKGVDESSTEPLPDSTFNLSFPYPTNPDDHCETSLQCYHDIHPILNQLCKIFGKTKESLQIYDPYFCNGSVVKHLASLGYVNVYNKREDCYASWEAKSEPSFDVLMTNPPYSGNHIQSLMEYVTSSLYGRKPFLLLMPNWVHKKDYYRCVTNEHKKKDETQKRKRSEFNSCSDRCNPFYIVPKKRYLYLPPPGFRTKRDSDVHKKSSPFTSMWYVWGGTHDRNEALLAAFKQSGVEGCNLARSRSALRDLRRGSGTK